MIERKLRRLHSSAFSYFVAVAGEGSFRAAARKLRIASSAVNRHVLLLEQELGFLLFDRSGRDLKMTAAGDVLLRHCQATVRGFEDMLEELDALRDIRSGVIRVAASESFAAEIVPDICARFAEYHPGIRIHVTVAESGVALASVAQDQSDVGFVFGTDAEGARIVSRFDLPIGAVVGPQHPLADRTTVTVRECLDHPLVIPDADLSFRRRLDEVTDVFRSRPHGGVEASSPRLMIGVARLNRHVAFQTMIGLAGDVANGSLVFIPLADKRLKPDRCMIVTSTRSAGRFAAETFCSYAADVLHRMLSSTNPVQPRHS